MEPVRATRKLYFVPGGQILRAVRPGFLGIRYTNRLGVYAR